MDLQSYLRVLRKRWRTILTTALIVVGLAALMTVLTPNYLVTHDEVPDELAYQMARLLYANLDALKAAHSAANDIDPMKAAQNLPVPLHPGAARYYQEAGVPIE